jgi:hypothetical protein
MSNENDDDNDVHPSIYDDGEEDKGLFRWMNAFVVLLAVAGFFGLAWYAYKGGDQVVDENQVELVKADTTPIKEAPANPGGMQIPNQDKTVYSLINGDQAQKPVAERILPAPEQPINRSSGDTESWMSPKLEHKDIADDADAQTAQNSTPAPPAAAAPAAQKATPAAAAPAADATATPAPEKKAEQFNPAKLRKAEAAAAAKQDTDSASDMEVKKAAGANLNSGIADSAPAEKPAVVADATAKPDMPSVTSAVQPATEAPAAAPAKTAKAEATHNDADDSDSKDDDTKATDTKAADSKTVAPKEAPAAKAPKGVHAQLGAYKSEGEAKARWDHIAKKFPDDLRGKQHYIVRADLGDRGVFYRLQVGPFTNSGQAEEFCLTFVSAGQGCFSVNAK